MTALEVQAVGRRQSNAHAVAGVLAPTLTPFTAELDVDSGRFVEHAKRLLADGCTGLVPFGTTGEALSLGLAERQLLLDALVEGGVQSSLLLPGTGLCNLPDTIVLTRQAMKSGCAGVLVLPPFYYKGVDDDGLFRYFAKLIESIADPRLKVYLYHIPPQAVIGFSIELVARLLEAFPGIVVGIKDSSGDWKNTHALLTSFPNLAVLSGSETNLLDNLRAGGCGCITATANVNAAAIRRLYDRWQEDEAEALQAELTALRATIQRRPTIPMLKHIVAHKLADPAWRIVRPPLPVIDEAEAGTVIADLYPAR